MVPKIKKFKFSVFSFFIRIYNEVRNNITSLVWNAENQFTLLSYADSLLLRGKR